MFIIKLLFKDAFNPDKDTDKRSIIYARGTILAFSVGILFTILAIIY